MNRTRVLMLPAFLLALSVAAIAEDAAPRTVILGAFGEEVAVLRERIANPSEETVMGVSFVTGDLNGRKVVSAQTGVGKVNAAMTTAIALSRFHPSEVIFSGIAGGVNPEVLPGDIIIGEKAAHHDYGSVEPAGFQNKPTSNFAAEEKNPMFFPCSVELVALAERVAAAASLEKIESKDGPRTPHIRKGVIVTGDAFISSSAKKQELREKFRADAVEMEGAAVAQVCYQQKVPFIIIRSISDNADDRAAIDVDKFYMTAARNSAQFVAILAEALGKAP